MLFRSCLSSIFSLTPSQKHLPQYVLVLGEENSGKTCFIHRFLDSKLSQDQRVLRKRALETFYDSWKNLLQGGCNLPENLEPLLDQQEVLREIVTDPRFRSFAFQNGLGSALESVDFWSRRTRSLSGENCALNDEEAYHAKVKSFGYKEYFIKKPVELLIIDVPAKDRFQDDLLSKTNASAFCFIFGLDTFDVRVNDDSSKQKFQLENEMERFFRFMYQSKDYILKKGIPIIIFLNKVDLFTKKLENGVLFTTKERFTDFEVENAPLDYLKRKIRSGIPKEIRRQHVKLIYNYVSSTTDFDQGKKVAQSIKSNLLQRELSAAGFL